MSNHHSPPNKINWTPEMIARLRTLWATCTAQQMADAFSVSKSAVRLKLYELGLRRFEPEYWTEEQVAFLRANYKSVGDTELAKVFNERWPKKKGWTIHRIGKKRDHYLKLKRTAREIFDICSRDTVHIEKMNWGTSMERRGYPVGTIVVRTINGYTTKLMRVKSGFRKLALINYETAFGPIPTGTVVVMKDGDPLNCDPSNLEAVNRAAQAERMRNADASIAAILATRRVASRPGSQRKDEEMFFHFMNRPDILDIKRKQLQLRRALHEKEQQL